MNRVLLVGRLTKDPELKHFDETDKNVCKFTLAVNRNRTNANGEKEADFIPVVVWGKNAENITNYMKKGSLISIMGRLQIRSYEGKDGIRKYSTEVIGEEVQFLQSKNKTEEAI